MFNPEIARGAIDRAKGERGFEVTQASTSGETQAAASHPERNEDAIAVQKDALIVCDGVGGEQGSHMAAYVAAEYMREAVTTIPEYIDPQEAAKMLAEIMRDASQAIRMFGNENGIDGRIATAALTAIRRIDPASGLPYVAAAHAGDVRMTQLRDNKSIFTTLDHSGIGAGLEAQDARKIQNYLDTVENEDQLDDNVLAGFETRLCFEYRNTIASCLDNESNPADIPVRVSLRPVEPGDIFLVTSDGVHDNLTTAEIEAEAVKARSPHDIPDRLIIAAEKRSADKRHLRAKPDDMTAGVLLG